MFFRKVKYICLKCKVEEKIPLKVVRMMDELDGGDSSVPPRFACVNCNGTMEPIYYKNKDGREYRYKT